MPTFIEKRPLPEIVPPVKVPENPQPEPPNVDPAKVPVTPEKPHEADPREPLPEFEPYQE